MWPHFGLCILVVSISATQIYPIITHGVHFVDSITAKTFVIKGVDYQPGGSSAYSEWSDPLSHPQSCARDIYLFKRLGINTIRVYSVNPRLDHDICMTLLAQAGIYVLLDVNSPVIGESLNRYEPWTSYSPSYLKRVFEIVDQFSTYNNTLGFFVGNEVVNDPRSARVSPPYIRAVTRDLKDYIENHAARVIPVGYSAVDDLKYRHDLANYLTCGSHGSSVDFYGLNSYQWCGKQTMQSSGYDALLKDHTGFDIPLFMSEFGCNHVAPREFQEVEALFSAKMLKTFSGALAFEFTQEPNEYGLVKLDKLGNAQLLADFSSLEAEYKLVDLSSYQSEIALLQRPAFSRRCPLSFPNLGSLEEVPESYGTDMIRRGVRTKRGQLLEAAPMVKAKYSIRDEGGAMLLEADVQEVLDYQSNRSKAFERASFRQHPSTESPFEKAMVRKRSGQDALLMKTEPKTPDLADDVSSAADVTLSQAGRLTIVVFTISVTIATIYS